MAAPGPLRSPVKKPAKKSGLRRLRASEVLFEDGAKADSLFIIQKGQLRLYKPKGRGFIEIAVLRTGEVIGEMAYFDDDGGGTRSCAAMAMVNSEVVEISFTAFAKTMESLNPWFKTIINTLAKRLRATNSRVKELESNSASVNYATGKQNGYEFLKTNEIIKVMGTLFLVYKAHGEDHESGVAVHRKTLELYAKDIYTINETKLDAVIFLLSDLGYLKLENDQDGLPKVLVARNIELIRSFFIFYNTEKFLTEDKKLSIGVKCQIFLEKLIAKSVTGALNEESVELEIQDIIDEFKAEKIPIGVEHLEEAKEQGLCGDPIIGKDNILRLEINQAKIKKLLPTIQFKNALAKKNQEQQK